MRKKHSIGFYTFLFVFLLSITGIGNWVDRTQSTLLLLAFGSAFASYLFVLQEKESPNLLFALGIGLRVSLFFSLPSLSDDIYRFLWDGTLLKNDIHPFENLPGFYLGQDIDGINQVLFDRLNSPNYFSIYPPINQFIFWLSVVIGNGSWLTSANVIRTILLIADIGSFYFLKRLLKHYNKSQHLAFWYFLNPLVVLEFTGNLHFEGIVIFFLLGGIYFYEANKKWISSSAIGLAIGTKLLPLIYLPYFFIKGLKEQKWSISIIAGLIGFGTLLPMVNEAFITGMQTSLDLYFRSFEFNASIYFVAREIGYLMYGYNNIAQIGPLLSLLSIISIIAISTISVWKKWDVPSTLLLILTSYLLFTTTVHPWYILPLLTFGILSDFWYPIVWSFMIFLTYLGYSDSGFELPMIIVIIEYLIVMIVLLLELRMNKLFKKSI